MSGHLFYATHSGDPYYNMAMDEWMFSRVIDTPGLIILRLYSWDKGTITFGLNQKFEHAIDTSLIGNTPLIRRVTGGRALYHDRSELTYSIAVNSENLSIAKLNGTMTESSRQIAQAMIGFLAEIGLSAQYMRQSSPEFSTNKALHTQHCFQSRARHEIICDNRKIVASAQRRIGPAFLQHGSIKLKSSVSHPAISSELSKLVTDSVIQSLTASELEVRAGQFCRAFAEYFGVEFKKEGLRKSEENEIASYRDYLEKNCLKKRELIKQKLLINGLYLEAVN